MSPVAPPDASQTSSSGAFPGSNVLLPSPKLTIPKAPKKKNNKKKKSIKTKSNGDLRSQDVEAKSPAENGDGELEVEEDGQSAVVRDTCSIVKETSSPNGINRILRRIAISQTLRTRIRMVITTSPRATAA